MIIYVIISILSLVLLVVLHELGHFLVAKRFGLKVEEFGIGIPPRIFARKFGETVYSFNLLPIGGFVKIYGEDQKIKDKGSFSELSIFQRALVLLGGVVAFWIVAFILLTFIMGLGFRTSVADDVHSPDARVMVLETERGFPAEIAGIKLGDLFISLSSEEEQVVVQKISDIRGFLSRNQGKEIIALVERGQLEKEISMVSLENDGIIGVFLERTEIRKYPWYQAPIQGALMTGKTTIAIVYTLGSSARNAILGEPLPPGVRIAGPVGIVEDFFVGALKRGLVDYLQVMVMVSISLAILNLLPIPALDGGRLLFLMIEKIKGRPINPKLEQNLIIISFIMLIGIFFLVTFHDIRG